VNYFIVFIGGGIGSLCRYAINEGMQRYQINFPFATFLANVISCLIFGITVGLFLKGSINAPYRLFLLTGFCGGFSTFSTFTNETLLLLNQQQWGLAIVNIIGSIIVCLLALFVGIKLTSL
jgi:CrcB protein